MSNSPIPHWNRFHGILNMHLALHLRSNVFAHDVRCSMSQFLCTGTRPLHHAMKWLNMIAVWLTNQLLQSKCNLVHFTAFWQERIIEKWVQPLRRIILTIWDDHNILLIAILCKIQSLLSLSTTLHTHLYSTVIEKPCTWTVACMLHVSVQHKMCMSPFTGHKSHRKKSGHSHY